MPRMFLSLGNSLHSLNFFHPILVCAITDASLQPLAFNLSSKKYKLFTSLSWSYNVNFSAGLTIPFIVSTHLLQIKHFTRVKITLFVLAHLPCTYLPHFVHVTKFAITLVTHLAHGSNLLFSTSSFEPLTIILIFLRLTFSPW